VSEARAAVAIYTRTRNWEPVVLKRSEDVIGMPEFGLRCLVADLYLGTVLHPLPRQRRGAEGS